MKKKKIIANKAFLSVCSATDEQRRKTQNNFFLYFVTYFGNWMWLYVQMIVVGSPQPYTHPYRLQIHNNSSTAHDHKMSAHTTQYTHRINLNKSEKIAPKTSWLYNGFYLYFISFVCHCCEKAINFYFIHEPNCSPLTHRFPILRRFSTHSMKANSGRIFCPTWLIVFVFDSKVK